MRARDIAPVKRFGQNFLSDPNAARKIASLAVRAPGARVFEVGAGTGALTAALVGAGASVAALEIDRRLVPILRANPALATVEIIEGDALQFDYDAWAGDAPWDAAGNLPYNIATPLVLDLLALAHPPQRMTFMLQRDVVDRLTARPGTPAYGSLSIAVQFHATVTRAMTLGPGAFHPRPKVDSSVAVIERRATPAVHVLDVTWFDKVVRGAFAYRRKTLANSLALALSVPRERTVDALERAGLDPEIRAEQLSIDAFAALSDALSG